MSSLTAPCKVPDCEGVSHCSGLCQTHYNRKRKGLSGWDSPIRHWYQEKGCLVPRCEGKHRTSGLCQTHYVRMHRFGISAEKLAEYDQRECEICGASPSEAVMHIDHDHSCCPADQTPYCGKCVRGVLCQSCNLGLGQFQDNPDRIRNVLKYLSANGIE